MALATRSRASSPKAKASSAAPETLTEGILKGASLGQEMKRLGMRLLPDSRVAIRFVILDSGKAVGMSVSERKRARTADKELLRRTGRDEAGHKTLHGISPERAKALRAEATPLLGRETVYHSLKSALRAAKEHIPKRKGVERERISGLIGEIRALVVRVKSVNIGERERGAKVRVLQEDILALKKRNLVFLQDIYAENAAAFLAEAAKLLERADGQSRGIACAKLTAARNVLGEKLEHDQRDVLAKNERRMAVLEAIIDVRGERNEAIRNSLKGIMDALEASAATKDGTSEAVAKALVKLMKPGEEALSDEGQWLFPDSRIPELKLARDLVMSAATKGTRAERTRLVSRGIRLLEWYQDKVREEGLMHRGQTRRLGQEILVLERKLKNSNEEVLIEARNLLLGMGEMVIRGNPHRALDLAGTVLEKLKQADELAG